MPCHSCITYADYYYYYSQQIQQNEYNYDFAYNSYFYHPLLCEPCPAGTFAGDLGGGPDCIPCPPNTFSAAEVYLNFMIKIKI